MIRAAGAQKRKIWAPFGDMASEKELARIRRSGHMRRSVSRSRCVFALAGETGEPWRRWMLPGWSRDVGGVPAVVVIRHDLLVAAAGVPDGHLVVPWVPGRRRRLIMGWCRVC
jgi:hypothetical protein